LKAKEYYAKYGEKLMNPKTEDGALADLLADFAKEANDLIRQRKASSNKSVLAIIDELNKKWNSLCDMFPVRTLIRNGYQTYWYQKLNLTKEQADDIRKGKNYILR
jgi:hypothetical protein